VSIDKQLIRAAVTDLVNRPVRDDQPLVTSGLVDSLRVLKLITSLEQRLEVKIPADQLQPEDFDSVDGILETLERVGIE
jgi:acyl carrier protein